MNSTRVLFGMVTVGIALSLAASWAGVSAPQLTGEVVRIDNDDLGGVVTSAKGPEAGVWVIARRSRMP